MFSCQSLQAFNRYEAMRALWKIVPFLNAALQIDTRVSEEVSEGCFPRTTLPVDPLMTVMTHWQGESEGLNLVSCLYVA